ncbi:ABC transporter permease [Thiohalocapsa sp.]|uniref:ABC transporter permease n=1 Tax=Thiohalocapsa sp. TaxID=2497641 RepID=UPI0025E833C2|nr:ABC transporter permease [Thiohalocapsa sp.]
MAILSLALRSLLNRHTTVLLTLASIALSVALLVGVERLRTETRASFASTIAGTDLIVGARSGPVQLLLYSVFRIGNATNNISWESYQDLADQPRVAWTVPLSLGDSHRGFRVLGTTDAYLAHYRYGRDQPLALTEGAWLDDLFDAVLGAEVADRLGYRLGDSLTIAHGAGDVAFARHDDKPFRVAGILARTGTPVDRTVHVSLEAIEAIHLGWRGGAPMPGVEIGPDQARAMDLTPEAITAVLVGLDSRIATFGVQRWVNDYPEEPLLAILPGVALAELWSLVGVAENALLVVSACVVLVGLIGMLTALLIGLNERRREMAILRSVGARPAQVLGLIVGEAAFVTLLGLAAGVGLLYLLLMVAQPLLASELGLFIDIGAPSLREWLLLATVLCAGVLAGLLPGWRAYRMSLADGLSIRV